MKSANQMTDKQLVKWVEKTNITAWNAYNVYGNHGDSDKMIDLRDRWDELKSEMVARNIWGDFCQSQGYVQDHNFSDVIC